MFLEEKIGKKALSGYASRCIEIVPELKDTHLENTITEYIKLHDNKIYDELLLKPVTKLYSSWYKSIRDEYNPDYSVYSDPFYFAEVWLCWIRYSRRSVKELTTVRPTKNKVKSIFDIVADDTKSILDLGCGIGYTTVSLKEIFPNASVKGTNIKDCYQYLFAQSLFRDYDVSMIDDYQNINFDLIFASEYFEHFERPIEHLQDVLLETKPKYVVAANAFTVNAIGHFDVYKHENKILTGKETSKLFSKTLESSGFIKLKTNCWNDRPSVYAKNDSILENFM